MDPYKNNYPPPQQGGYPPPQQGGYPPQQGGYPPQQGGYPPPQQGGYPPQQGGYPPPQQGGYPPPQQGGYPPPQQGGYPPPQQGGYPPPQQGGYPPPQGGYPPPQQGGYPPPQGGYPPPQQAGYPPPQGGYPPPQQGGYPPSQQAGYPPPQYGGYPNQQTGAPYYDPNSYYPNSNQKVKGIHKEAPGFNPNADAIALNKAFKGIGCNSNMVFSILCKRSMRQRTEIARCYDQAFNTNLVPRLKSELIGIDEKFAVSLILGPAQRDAYWIRTAIKGVGTDEKALIDILCTRSNAEIKQIISCYQADYNRDIKRDISSDTSGNFRDILLVLCDALRNESNIVDKNMASSQIMSLIGSTSGITHSGSKTYTPLFTSVSRMQLRQIKAEFPKLSGGKDIYMHIKQKFARDYERTLLALVHSSDDITEFYVSRLKSAIKNASVKDIIRIFISRCEIDLQTIMERYEMATQRKLVTDLQIFVNEPIYSGILMLINLK